MDARRRKLRLKVLYQSGRYSIHEAENNLLCDLDHFFRMPDRGVDEKMMDVQKQ